MRKKIVLRMAGADFCTLKAALVADLSRECQAFALCSHGEGPEENIFIVNKLLIPDADDLTERSSVSVAPSREFQATVYGLARDLRASVFDFHTHPWTNTPSLSGIDSYHGEKNARYICARLGTPSTMGMVVWGGSLRGFDGRVWDPVDGQFDVLDQIEVLGTPVDILRKGADKTECTGTYARQLMIPGWQQGRLEKLQVVIVGLSGNGSHVFPALGAMGVGRDGWIRTCDPERIEESNLSRILYASPKDVGVSKATVAKRYATSKFPDTPVDCYAERIQDEKMVGIAKEAHLLVSCPDNDGARQFLNGLAARYQIPLLDLGTEIIPAEDGSCEAVGQVRTFIPGLNGCLICGGAIDASQAALGLMSEEERVEHARAGYVRGTTETPTPSVLSLNGATAYLATSQFLRIIFGESPEKSAFIHYDRQQNALVAASVNPNPDCPVCGEHGYVGSGDEVSAISARRHTRSTKTFTLHAGEETGEEEEVDALTNEERNE